MIKTIQAKDVKIGDVVGRSQVQLKGVNNITNDHGMVKLWYEDGTSILCVGSFVLWHLDYNN